MAYFRAHAIAVATSLGDPTKTTASGPTPSKRVLCRSLACAYAASAWVTTVPEIARASSRRRLSPAAAAARVTDVPSNPAANAARPARCTNSRRFTEEVLQRAAAQPLEHRVGDLVPAPVDRQRVAAVRKLLDLGHRCRLVELAGLR